MTRRSRAPHWSTAVLVVVTACALGAAATLAVVDLTEPETLRPPTPARSASVEERTDADARLLQLTLVAGAERVVAAPRGGVLTSLSCTPGDPVWSGSAIATIDGDVVVALGSDVPLWRDLATGVEGADVLGLQREISRLGFPVAADGVVGPRTIRAVQRLLDAAGSSSRLTDSIPVDRFAWVPGRAVPSRSCEGTVGVRVDPGAPLVALPVDLVRATVVPPADATEGARELVVGSVTAPVDPDGAVRDRATLDAIAGTEEYATATAADGAAAVPVDWRLRSPDPVLVVPPAALYDLRDGTACVQVPPRRDPVQVAVLGSDLGQSFVRPAGRAFRQVDLQPDRDRSCR